MATRRRRMKEATEAADDTIGEAQVHDVPPGTELTVVWGEETFSPVQYNSFRVGGHSIKVVVQPGESGAEAFARGWKILEEAAEVQFADKLKGFKQRIDRTKGR